MEEREAAEAGPAGGERTPAHPPGSPSGRKALAKQVRIVLTPVSESKTCKQRLTQKRLLEHFSSCREAPAAEPQAKRLRHRPWSPPVGAAASPDPAGVLLPTGSPLSASVAAAPSNDAEEDGAGPDSDEQDAGAASVDNESTQLSAYEKKRLKNITENAKFFASLKLFESAERLRKLATKGQPCGIRRAKPTKAGPETARRRSMRLQRVDPLGARLPEPPAQPDLSVGEHPLLPRGPLQMIPAGQDLAATSAEGGLLSTWARISQETLGRTEKPLCNLASYKTRLRGMVLREDAVAKVVQRRVCSVAVHPSESRTLLAAGDKWGQIGLWDLDGEGEDGVRTFDIHSQAVGCLSFSPSNPAHLLSLSYDGTLRCGDVSRAIFDEVYRNEESRLSSFDFLAGDASTLLVGTWDGDMAVVDRRTPGTASELSAALTAKIRTVHVHPVNRNYFVAAGAGEVGIYDIRHLKKSGNRPAVSLPGHRKSVASAYFSPITGNRVVTTCADDALRIFGTHCLSSLAPLLATIRHNNNTGRWLTRFRAEWDPKQEDCFVVGSMSRPRQIEAFHASGELVHSFLSEDCLVSVCSVNAWHPTAYIMAGGNSSGRLHVFRG